MDRDRTDGEGARRPAVMVALIVTLALGVWLRWFFTGRVALVGALPHLRHAHSHLGYFGVLFPLAWLGWRAAGAPVPGRRAMVGYGAATALSVVGFLRAGYGIEAIIGSTIVGGIWLWSAWRLRDRLKSRGDPLALMLPGVVLALACIPPIGVLLRRDPLLAQMFVITFLAALLLVVLVPAALAASRIAPGPWPLLLISATASAAALGVWPAAPARVGMALFGILIVSGALRQRALPRHLGCVWLATGGGLIAMASGLLPDNRPVAIGAFHFVILGPVLGSLAPFWLRRNPSSRAWMLGFGGVALMSGALVAQGLGVGSGTADWAAVGGSWVALWWMIVLARDLHARRGRGLKAPSG